MSTTATHRPAERRASAEIWRDMIVCRHIRSTYVDVTSMISFFKPILGLLLTAAVSLLSLYLKNVNNRATNIREGPKFSQDLNQRYLKYTDEAKSDLVTSLPGLNFYYSSSIVQFSGFLTVDEAHGRNIHYWYVESTRDPENDPVILWTNGGPGCSGLLGFGTEFGPFQFNGDGTLSLNPFTWNSIASIIYIEQPAGVGFSYSNQPETDYTTGDRRATLDNFKAIQEFFKRFPERRNNDFYIASESYGGHYIPQLALEILDRNVDGALRFRGFLVGNPYVDPFSNDVTMMETYYMHGLFAKPVYDHWKNLCSNKATYDVELCATLIEKLMSEAGDRINPYALDFPICPDESFSSSSLNAVSAISRKLIESSQSIYLSHQIWNHKFFNSPPFLPNEDVYQPCAEKYLTNYLNREDVKTALHVSSSRTWKTCTDEISYSQEDIMTSQIHSYKELVNRAKMVGSNLKILIFSGDDDSVCSTASTQYWIYDIGLDAKADELWKPWKYKKQTAGYVTQFDLGNTTSSFTFATVHGAGHEVPAYRPAEALALFKSFFSGYWEH